MGDEEPALLSDVDRGKPRSPNERALRYSFRGQVAKAAEALEA